MHFLSGFVKRSVQVNSGESTIIGDCALVFGCRQHWKNKKRFGAKLDKSGYLRFNSWFCIVNVSLCQPSI
jgi:hypothetical protein